jgi:hypothetical protein
MSLRLATPSERSETRTGITRKFQPTPATPTPLLPRAAIEPATSVPCPLDRSLVTPPSTCARFVVALKPGTSGFRSGWLGITPVSHEATMISLPPVSKSHAPTEFIFCARWCHCWLNCGSLGTVASG